MNRLQQRVGRNGIRIDGRWYWHSELLLYLGFDVGVGCDGDLVQVFYKEKIIHSGHLHQP